MLISKTDPNGWPRQKTDQNGSSWPIQNHQPSDRFASESWYSRRDFRFSISVSWSRTKSWQELRAALELAHFKWQMSSFFWPQSSSTGLVNPGLTLLHKSDRGHVGILAGFCTCHYISLRWLMGESTGNQRSCIKGLPVNFPVTQFGLQSNSENVGANPNETVIASLLLCWQAVLRILCLSRLSFKLCLGDNSRKPTDYIRLL